MELYRTQQQKKMKISIFWVEGKSQPAVPASSQIR